MNITLSLDTAHYARNVEGNLKVRQMKYIMLVIALILAARKLYNEITRVGN